MFPVFPRTRLEVKYCTISTGCIDRAIFIAVHRQQINSFTVVTVLAVRVYTTVQCLKKAAPLQLICHNFTNSHLLFMFGTDRPYSIQFIKLKSFKIGLETLEPAAWFPQQQQRLDGLSQKVGPYDIMTQLHQKVFNLNEISETACVQYS